MTQPLRDLIREVRQSKSAAEERAVIAKELAAIRTAFKDKSKLEFRHRNVAKLMYVDMLGYATHFGQMEVLKLLATPSFPEKRIGYLALMQLLDENTEVLMLATQALKNDMHNSEEKIVGLALCAMGNIASQDISRDLGSELEKLLKSGSPYIRKKALCCAIRVIQRVPEMCEEYFQCAITVLEDTTQLHGPLVAAIQLLNEICKKESKYCKKLKKHSAHIVNRLKSLLLSSYDPDHDIGGVTDPFLQVHLLNLLRTISINNKMADDLDDILAQIATHTESNKNPGNSILYECVRTIMAVDVQSSLHVLAINILGRFLVNRDNNIRYVALNALCNAVETNQQAIQRHRNTIVECLKDIDLTIRRRALDLIYALTNKKNIQTLVGDLLSYLVLSSNEPEFREELASKICMVVERYSPSRKWHIDTILQVLSTVGNFTQDNSISNLFILIANTPDLQAYVTYKLYDLIEKDIDSDQLRKLTAWCIGEYGNYLATQQGLQAALIDQEAQYTIKTEENVVNIINKILSNDNSSITTKGFCLVALVKLTQRLSSNIHSKIQLLTEQYKENIEIELQQRSIENLQLLTAIQSNTRAELLKAMPVPDLSKLVSDNNKSFSDLNNDFIEDDNTNLDVTIPSRNNDDKRNADETGETSEDSDEEDSDEEKTDKGSKKKSHKKEGNGVSKSTQGGNNNTSTLTSGKNNQDMDLLNFDDILSGTNTNTNTKTQANNTNISQPEDFLAVLLGTPTNVSNNNNNNNNNINLINPVKNTIPYPNLDLDINSNLNTNTNLLQTSLMSPTSSSQLKQQQQQDIPPLTIFSKDGISIQLNFVKADNPGVCRIIAGFSNSNSFDIQDFSFMVAVPKYINLQIKLPSSSVLPPMSVNQVTQKLQLTNMLHGQKPLMIRVQISYTRQGQKITERTQVDNFPPNCC